MTINFLGQRDIDRAARAFILYYFNQSASIIFMMWSATSIEEIGYFAGSLLAARQASSLASGWALRQFSGRFTGKISLLFGLIAFCVSIAMIIGGVATSDYAFASIVFAFLVSGVALGVTSPQMDGFFQHFWREDASFSGGNIGATTGFIRQLGMGCGAVVCGAVITVFGAVSLGGFLFLSALLLVFLVARVSSNFLDTKAKVSIHFDDQKPSTGSDPLLAMIIFVSIYVVAGLLNSLAAPLIVKSFGGEAWLLGLADSAWSASAIVCTFVLSKSRHGSGNALVMSVLTVILGLLVSSIFFTPGVNWLVYIFALSGACFAAIKSMADNIIYASFSGVELVQVRSRMYNLVYAIGFPLMIIPGLIGGGRVDFFILICGIVIIWIGILCSVFASRPL